MVSLRHFDMAKKNYKNKTWKNKQIEKIGEHIGILSITIAKFHKPGSVKYLSFCLVLYIFYIK